VGEVRASACPLDCPDACSLAVTVDGDRVVSIDGDERNRLTGGFICTKVRNFVRHMTGAERLATPLVRSGAKGSGTFVEASWDDALARIATRLREVADRDGGEAILPLCYGGSNGVLSQDCVDARMFRRLGASRLARTVCAAPTGSAATGLYGKMPGVDLADYEHANLVLLWGCNPSATGIHLVPPLQRARARGAKLVVVDPRRIPLGRTADIHLALHPGTDVVVALAIAKWLFDHGCADLEFLAAHATGVDAFRERASPWTIERAAAVARIDAHDLERTAALYAESSPAAIRCGWGIERNRNGGSATAAILALPAVAGKFGVRGGGYTMSNGRALPLATEVAIAEPERPTREINMSQVGRVLNDPRGGVSALFVYNCNPVATLPDQNAVRRGMQRDDLFTVVFDQVMTDSAMLADVVLPATTFLEHDELRSSYGATAIQRSRAVARAWGQSRPNHEVFAELCERLGIARPGDPRGADELAAAIVGASTGLPPGAADALTQHDIVEAAAAVQFVDIFPRTVDAKVHLLPAALDAEAGGRLYAYRDDPATSAHPLALVSPALGRQISSTFGQLDRRPALLHMHPDDAHAHDLADGAHIRVFNELGDVRCRLAIDDEMRPGVVSLAKGLWSRRTDNGATANALCSDALADLGGGATFNDARVQVEAAPSSPDVPPAL
jgi:anaerobic selenocysteine-containing dehydrogenase